MDTRSSQATIACPEDAEHLTGAPSPQRKTGGWCQSSIVGPEHALRWQGLRPVRGHSSCLNRPNRLVMTESFAVTIGGKELVLTHHVNGMVRVSLRDHALVL